MKYAEKALKLRELFYYTNKSFNPKWKNKQELESYLSKFGGRVKEDRKRRKGYLVCLLQEGRKKEKDNYYDPKERPDLVAEVPMEFAMKVIVLGGFP